MNFISDMCFTPSLVNIESNVKKQKIPDCFKIRALVGLCKVGSSHGGDVSRRVFAEGSSLKLSRQCRKYLINSGKWEMKKWSVEGLSYLSLDGDVKEELWRGFIL